MLIGIDWGGTKMEVIGLSDQGQELVRHRIPTPREDYEGSIRAVVDLVGHAEQATGLTGHVGLGIPGSPNPKTGLIRNANSWWLNGKPLGRDLEQALGRPVRLSNDANCLAVSEAVDGAGAGCHVVHGIIIGTGHGSGIAIDGRPHNGFQGLGGEIGHYSLPWPKEGEYPGPKCWCGRTGCLEMYCSGTGFQDDYERATGTRLSGREIVAKMRADDPDAKASYGRYADRLARSLALIIDILDPDVFVLGGGMSNVDELYDDLPRLMTPYVFSDSVETPIRKAKFGDSSGVRGAAWLWKD
ncbi:ROK family protein [Chthonobacter albigriseus]|uniref:ROK family protein n=1 Tax=Chthonobacter albigriseus TaxID=1683161 RepID=UPI0015EEA38E|nr:ROK family protein [Chthonobacter albigriseus]